MLVFFEARAVHEGVCVTMLILVIQTLLHILVEVLSASMAHNVLRKYDTKYHVSKNFSTLMHTGVLHEQVNNTFFNVPLSSGHRVIDITNGHFIHASPLEGTRVSIYLSFQ